ncbi:hypothetical protein ZTR_09425 [Talaromyces verruculosus]|nr:hypothetical protein ZTR_09425 [Talaromyces verruculosus]
MSTNESQEATNGADVSDIAINQLLGQTLATAMEETVNTAIANAVENAINAAVDDAVNDVQEAVNKSLKRSIDHIARDAVEKAIKKLRDGCFEQHLTTFLSKNEGQASQKDTAPTGATNDQAKSIKVVKDFHRHASDLVYPGRTYQIYVQDHATGDDYCRMLYSHPALLLQLASPEQVESGEVRVSRCNWKCFKKGASLFFYNPATKLCLNFYCDDLKSESTYLGLTLRVPFEKDSLFRLQRNTDGEYMFLHNFEGRIHAVAMLIHEKNYCPSNLGGIYAALENKHERGEIYLEVQGSYEEMSYIILLAKSYGY